MSPRLPSLDDLKSQARRLRASLATAGTEINHARALELVARQLGYADWNTLHAAVGNDPPPPRFSPGDHVAGRYLGQRFAGEVIGIEALTSRPGFSRITLHFDEPVDVVTFDSFSAFRRRVVATIDEKGISPDRTSDGRSHLVIDG